MSIDIEKVRARAEAATPGPWRQANSADDSVGHSSVLYGDRFGVRNIPWDDAEFIAHAREDVPALLDEVERFAMQDRASTNLARSAQERAEKAEAERDRLRAAVGAVKALVAKGWVDFHNTEVTVDLPAIRAALDEHLGEG